MTQNWKWWSPAVLGMWVWGGIAPLSALADVPQVRRRDYIVMDRRLLKYLNPLERLNCGYCEYTNGVLAYVQEIAGRTEQYWCPIKHAIGLKTRHSRYSHFLDFGDAEQYRQRIEQVRRDFEDLRK